MAKSFRCSYVKLDLNAFFINVNLENDLSPLQLVHMSVRYNSKVFSTFGM
jgi:hypothetical protein